MKINLPIIGEVVSGKDIPEPQKKDISEVGGFLDFSSKRLSDEKTVNEKLIKAFEEWVYINVSTLAETVSLLEFELFKFQMVRGQVEMVPVKEHELLDLLNKFNEVTTQSDAIYNTEAHLDLTGDAFWLLDGGKNGAKPSEIYLLQPDKVDLKLGDFTRATTIVTGYEYKVEVDGKQRVVEYEPEEVLHIKVPNPGNPYRGKSTVEALVNTIDTDNFAGLALNNLFRNGMLADFMLSTDKRMTPDQLRRFRAQFKQAYTGVRNAWNIPILFGGVKPERLQMSGREMQLIELEEWLRNKIMSAFKNTRASLGIDDEVNRSTSESSILNWKRSVITPKMTRIVNYLNEFLVPRYGDNLVLGFKDPVPEDRDKEIDEATKLYEAGIITRNEARQAVKYEEMTGQDDFKSNPLSPAFNEQVERRFPALKHVNYRKAFRKSEIYSEAKDYWDTFTKARKVVKKMRTKEKEEPREHGVFTNEQVWDYSNKRLKIVFGAEDKFAGAVESYLKNMLDKALSVVPQEVTEMQNKQLIDEEDEIKTAVALLSPILLEVALLSGQNALTLINVTEPYLSSRIRDIVTQNVSRMANSVVSTNKNKLINIITEGIQNGQSIPQIRNNIIEEYKTFSKVEAERIARTEVNRASVRASIDAWDQSGIVIAKQWLTAMDERVCPYCAPLNGKIIPLDRSYFKQGSSYQGNSDTILDLSYASVEGGDLHVMCRCDVLPVYKGQDSFDIRSFEIFQDFQARIAELEEKADKRTKKYKEWKEKFEQSDNEKSQLEEYIKELEKIAGIGDEK